VGEPVLGQSVEHIDGVVGEALSAHPVDDLLEVGRIRRLNDDGLLAEGVAGGGRSGLFVIDGGGGSELLVSSSD
jgi:hypothetical protein